MPQIYNDELFLVEQNNTYIYAPGFFIVRELSEKWDYSIENIKRFCNIQKRIRTFLLQNNYTLVMSYMEHSETDEMTLFILPYDLEVLSKLDIDPEEPQSHMFNYLNYFTKKIHADKAQKLASALKTFLYKEVQE